MTCNNTLPSGWIALPTALTMAPVMMMDHVTVMLAGLESFVTKRRVPPTVLGMENVIYKLNNVFAMIPILVSHYNSQHEILLLLMFSVCVCEIIRVYFRCGL